MDRRPFHLDDVKEERITYASNAPLLTDDDADWKQTTANITTESIIVLRDPLKDQTLQTLVTEYTITETLEGWKPFESRESYRRKKQVSRITKAQYLVVWLQRTKTVHDIPTLNKSPIKVSEYIILENNEWLSLQAVVVHAGEEVNTGHFVCYFKWTNDDWFLFDNPPNQKSDLVTRVGSLTNAIARDGPFNIPTKGFLFFYEAVTPPQASENLVL